MKPLVLATAVATFLSVGSAGAEARQEAWSPGGSSVLEPELFPNAFRGRWAPDRASCTDVDGLDLVQVYPGGVDSYESGGRLVRVTQSGQSKSIRVLLSYEGEGQFWDSDEVWTLSADGDRLAVFIAGQEKLLERCN